MVNQEKNFETDKTFKIQAEINVGAFEFQLTDLSSNSEGFSFTIEIPDVVPEPDTIPRGIKNSNLGIQAENLAYLKGGCCGMSLNNGLFNNNYFASLTSPMLVNNNQSIVTSSLFTNNANVGFLANNGNVTLPVNTGSSVNNNNGLWINNAALSGYNSGYYVNIPANNTAFLANTNKYCADNSGYYANYARCCSNNSYYCIYKNACNNTAGIYYCTECLYNAGYFLNNGDFLIRDNISNNDMNNETIQTYEDKDQNADNMIVDEDAEGNRPMEANLDEFDYFGRYVALSLRAMSLNRALNCQRNINDTLIDERMSDNEDDED